MKRYRHFIMFGLVLLLAIVLRSWQLGSVPPSPDWDETALGYNAYSLIRTGMDEYGTRWPLVFRSFDDYKPPLYVYLTIPAVAAFGLETWVVRLPSVVMGVLAVVGTFALVRELFYREKKRDLLALLSMGLLAISPWHIQFSRIAFEANTGVTLNIWAVAAALRALRVGRGLWIATALFGLALYAYHSERVFAPLLALILVVIHWKTVTKNMRQFVIAAIVGLAVVAPLIPVVFNPDSLTRLQGTSATADTTGVLARSVAKLEDDIAAGNPWGRVFDNRRIVYATSLIDGYLSHFSMRWLFLTGDNPRHHAPGMGLLYLWELPFLLVGLYHIARGDRKRKNVLLGWMLISPIAASPTTELPHAIRTLVFLPAFQIATAVGVLVACDAARKKSSVVRASTYGLVGAIVILSFIRYLSLYFTHMNIAYSYDWQYGRQEAVAYAESVKDQYDQIVISIDLEQPHMFFLFYTKYDPEQYLAEGGTASGGFEEYRNRFDRYIFRDIDWPNENHDGSTLYIGLPDEIQTEPTHTIYYLNGEEAIRIAP